MKFNRKLFGIIAVIFVIVAVLFLILSFALKYIIGAVIFGVVAGLVIGAIFKKDIEEIKQAARDIKEAQAQQKSESEPESGLEQTFNKLKDLNLQIKLNNFPKNVTTKTEEVIDKLVEILPKLNTTEFSGTNISWVVNQSANKYLGELFKEYSEMSQKNKEEKAGVIIEKLQTLISELDTIAGKLERREVDEFETEVEFWKRKFMGESVKM